MIKQDSGLQWSRLHNSRFEVNKSVVLHLEKQPRIPTQTMDVYEEAEFWHLPLYNFLHNCKSHRSIE